jgi:redox-sensitive bicupin YhaK (pirin superfamily)
MTIKRKLTTVQAPLAQPGFLGAGHTARAVIQVPYDESDPFILLMDDVLDKVDDEPVGGPHPHAGFETVSLLLQGEIGDSKHKMKAGDLQKMTAGSGVIHTETIEKKAKMRLLQLWTVLPKKDRWTLPSVQDLPLEKVPKFNEEGVEIRVYSGTLAGVSSPLQNYAAMIIADIHVEAGVTTTLKIPASYSAFLYVIDGSVTVGDRNNDTLSSNQVGWLDRFGENVESEIKLTAGASSARVVLYAGQPQGDEIVSHGPFIGDTEADIRRLYQEYRLGKMKHISTVPAEQRVMW